METSIERYNRRLGALRSERSSFIGHWTELNDWILPRSARFLSTDRNKGDRRNSRILDSTATLAVRALYSGMMGGMTSPSRPWFQLRTSDPQLNEFQPVKLWLELVQNRMAEMFLASNLYSQLPGTYQDLGVFGTNAFALLEDDEDGIRCYSYPVGSYCLSTDWRGKVNTCYREYQMTARQVVENYPETASLRTKNLSSSSPDAWIDVVHVVEPNPDHNPNRLESKFKRFVSVYYEKGEKTPLKESGFDSFPIMASRWALTGEDIYGYSPGMDALGDVKGLQLEQKRKVQMIEKGNTPPMVAPSSMRNGAASLLPGGINFLDVSQGQQGFAPAYTPNPGWLNPLIEDIREIQERIKKCFFEDLFLMMANIDLSGVSAQEIIEKKQEKLVMLGPVLNRLNDELLDPIIDRSFSIMLKKGMVPPPPQELHEQELSVEYTSVLAQAMKMSGLQGLQQLASFTMGMGQPFPEVLDKFNADASIDEMAAMLGTSPKLVNDATTVRMIRTRRQQQEQTQQAMQMAQQGAQTAQTLSQTNVQDPSALTAMAQYLQGA